MTFNSFIEQVDQLYHELDRIMSMIVSNIWLPIFYYFLFVQLFSITIFYILLRTVCFRVHILRKNRNIMLYLSIITLLMD